MANKFQFKRTTVSGRTANTTNVSNSAFIDKGEFAINLTDRKVFSSDAANTIFEVGSNLTSLSVTTLVANGSSGTVGQVLTSNGPALYWGAGSIGAQGAQGAQGVQGSAGTTGAQGVQGSQGAQGATGFTGSIGAQGVQGSQGAQGVQGSAGTTGAQGAQGVQGAQGSAGTTGAQGAQGSAGPSNVLNATNDTSATVHYPVFVTGTGNQTPRIRTTATALSYIPSTGTLKANAIGIGINPTQILHARTAGRGIDGLLIDSAGVNNPWVRILPDAAAGAYSNMVSDGDATIIFSGGTSGTGNLTISPWSSASSVGIRIQNNGNVGIGTGAPGFKLDVVDTINSRGDVRAPIFYDNNDTAYYLNPNGASRLSSVAFAGGSSVGVSGDIVARRDNGNTGAVYFGNAAPYIYWDGVSFYIDGGPVVANVDVRAPIFYDESDTAYYLNPNALSNLSQTSTYLAPKDNNGNWNTAFTNTPAANKAYHGDISTGGPSGAWWFYESMRHSNVNNVYGTQVAWGWDDNANRLLQRDVNNGNFSGWVEYLNTSGRTYSGSLTLNGTIIAQSDMRAPIFYDQNNTGFYVNPAGDSNLSTTYTYIGRRDANSNWNTAFSNTPAGTKGFNGDISAGGPSGAWWFYESLRHTNTSNLWGTQLAWGWQDNANRLQTRNVIEGNFGSWVEYLNTSGRTYSGNLTLTGSIISTASDVRAPIFYDQNDTSYYLNPQSTSNLSVLTMQGLLIGRSTGATNVNTANDDGSMSIRGSVSSVASVSFHRTGAFAINMGLGTDNVFRIGGWSASHNALQMTPGGDLTMLGNITAYSDSRLKKNINLIEDALNKIMSIRGVTFDRIDSGVRGAGVIAQEVELVLPEVVMENEDGIKSVAYGNMVGLLIEAIKEQQTHINRMQQQINLLLGDK